MNKLKLPLLEPGVQPDGARSVYQCVIEAPRYSGAMDCSIASQIRAAVEGEELVTVESVEVGAGAETGAGAGTGPETGAASNTSP